MQKEQEMKESRMEVPRVGRYKTTQPDEDSEEYDEDAAWGDVRRAKEHIKKTESQLEEEERNRIINPTEVSIKDGNKKSYDAATLLQHYKDR